ncbi:MAG: recombinase RecT [Spirochaetia bacterium]|jgi:recombination protein RecT|nr:recombinase RecT [Spirochaetia bacterium]
MKTDGSDANEKMKSVERSPVQGLKEIMNSEYVKKRFMEVMGEKSAAFIASVLSAVQKNPELAKCDPQSILSAAMVAATLDLPIDSNLGFSAIVPYNTKRKNGDGSECRVSLAQFQIMYKGFIQLALRSGQYKTINVSPIYEDEFESYDIITGDIIIHPVEGGYRYHERDDKIIGYAAFFRLLNGYERLEYWSLKKIMSHGERYSKSFHNKNGLWKTNPHAMCAKTVLKNTLSKWGILSVSMQSAIVADQAVIKAFDKPIDGENVRYIDSSGPPPETGDTEDTGETEAAEKNKTPEPPESGASDPVPSEGGSSAEGAARAAATVPAVPKEGGSAASQSVPKPARIKPSDEAKGLKSVELPNFGN